MLLIPNKHVIIPTQSEIIARTAIRNTVLPRQANTHNVIVINQQSITLPFTPAVPAWVEVYVAGKRLINPVLERKIGGAIYKTFNVVGNTILFNEPVTGEIDVIVDTVPNHHPSSAIVDVKNVQKEPYQHGLYCEPVILVQPRYGYARLTTDRQSIAYVPNRLFRGTDSFSYTLITQLGQVGPAQCAFIVVS